MYRFHINCYTNETREPYGHRDIEFTTHPTWKDFFDKEDLPHSIIGRVFSKFAGQPQLNDKIIPNIEFNMRTQNGFVGWSYMLFV